MQPEPLQGQIITRRGDRLIVQPDNNRKTDPSTPIRCAQRSKLPPLAVGDRVLWEPAGNSEGVITGLLERKSLLSRPDPFNRRRKPIAANIDQIIIVTAPQPGIDLLQIDRILIAAESIPLPSLLAINKSDLLSSDERKEWEQQLHHYEELGHPLLWTSAKSSGGLESLQQRLSGKSSVLVGPSGAGKSSIIKALLPEQEIAVGALSDGIGQGKHTTSVSTLYLLECGGSLIDSPGIREFGVWDLDEETIRNGFREFDRYAGHCRFSNCRHLDEPGCAVTAAVAEGKIPAVRIENYRKLIGDQ